MGRLAIASRRFVASPENASLRGARPPAKGGEPSCALAVATLAARAPALALCAYFRRRELDGLRILRAKWRTTALGPLYALSGLHVTATLNTQWAPIVDSEGVQAAAQSLPADESSLQVALAGGELVFVPRALVEHDQDGSYRFERSFRECLERVAGGEVVLPVVAEELQIGVRAVERERVRVTTSVSSREERVDMPLVQEQVVVERVPVGRVVDAISPPRQEGNTLIVPVYEEVIVVEKRVRLKEEVRITRTRHEEHYSEHVTLRQEHVAIERSHDRVNPSR